MFFFNISPSLFSGGFTLLYSHPPFNPTVHLSTFWPHTRVFLSFPTAFWFSGSKSGCKHCSEVFSTLMRPGSCCTAFNAVVAAFSLDISVFLSLSCTFEVYLRRWSFLECGLEQDRAHFIDICQIQGGWPPRTNTLGYLSALLSITGPFPCFLLLERNVIKEWDLSPTQRLKFWPLQ